MGQAQRRWIWPRSSALFTKILQQAEQEFKQEIDQYPYAVTHDLYREDGQWTDEIQEFVEVREAWLKANVLPGDYFAFPTSASGTYKSYWQKVFFKNKANAVLYKLMWM